MVSTENKMVQMMVQKMGLEGDTQLIGKAHELARFLKLKALGGNNISLSDSAQSIICIDLASSLVGISFDSEYAMKLSGLKKNAYLNGLRTVEKLLDLTQDLTVNELCIQLGITSVSEKAVILLEKYKETHDCDSSHPQYVCMAVHQACRLDKIKIQRSKITSFSHLKLSQWNILEKTWSKWVDEVASSLFGGTRNDAPQDSISEHCRKAVSNETNEGGIIETDEYQMEDYESWKNRILDAAYKELEAQKMIST